MKKRRIVFVVLYAVLIFINTIPIFIYRDKVQTAFSWLFLAVMLLELMYGIFCCVCKHKANFFRNYRRIHLFWKNDESTFTAEYQREFDCYAMIFFSSLPFYIPLIHFAAEPIHTLWGLLVLAFPWIAFSMIGIRDTLSEAKKRQSKKRTIRGGTLGARTARRAWQVEIMKSSCKVGHGCKYRTVLFCFILSKLADCSAYVALHKKNDRIAVGYNTKFFDYKA